MAITVFRVLSPSDPVMVSEFSSKVRRKLSKTGSELLDAITFWTCNSPCNKSVLDTINFIIFCLNFKITNIAKM
jgi:hypothetical protein